MGELKLGDKVVLTSRNNKIFDYGDILTVINLDNEDGIHLFRNKDGASMWLYDTSYEKILPSIKPNIECGPEANYILVGGVKIRIPEGFEIILQKGYGNNE